MRGSEWDLHHPPGPYSAHLPLLPHPSLSRPGAGKTRLGLRAPPGPAPPPGPQPLPVVAAAGAPTRSRAGRCLRGRKRPRAVPGAPRRPRPGPLLQAGPGRRQARLSAGAWTKGQGLGWEAKKEEAFLRSGTLFSGAEGLALPRDGLYYLYCHVGYRGRAPPAGRGPPEPPVTLRSRLFRAGGAYGPGSPELLLEGAETVTPAPGPARPREYGPLWYTSVGFGGLVQLRRGERVYVNISHPDMVDYRRGKTFFGAVMVG